MTTYLGKSCSFGLLRVPFVNCRQFMYLVISLLVLRAGLGIWLYQFLIIAYLLTLIKQQQTILYIIKWVTVHNDFWLVSLTCLIIANGWLWPDQLIDILCLIFLNINNIQHQLLKLFIQKRYSPSRCLSFIFHVIR